MYAIWAVEKVTIDPKTNRPVYTERKGTYNLNVKGTLCRFKDDGSGIMDMKVFKGGIINYSAKPQIVLVTERAD